LSDESGLRVDVLEAMSRMRMPAVRYPGGNFVSNYDWKDGVGPIGERPTRADFAWKTREPNTFGTDEFIDWCRKLETQPMLAVNLGTGTPKSAAELVEYCNMASGTDWSDRRGENGHAAPHAVPMWCLGNEMDGTWQAGHVPAAEYALRANQAGKLMKGIDPSIELVVAGSSGRRLPTYMEWDREVLEYTWDTVDYISAHRYSRNDIEDTPWFLAEGVEIERVIQDYRGLLGYVKAVKKSDRDVFLSFDEWNVWYKDRVGNGGWQDAPPLIEEVYNLEDALVCAQYLNAFIRNADIVKIACLAQIVNVIAPILTRPDGILLQSTYWPIVAMAQAMSGGALRAVVDGPACAAGERGEVAMLDVAGSYDAGTQVLSLSLVNRSLDDSVEVGLSTDLSVEEVISSTTISDSDPKAYNTWDAPDVITPVECAVQHTGGNVTASVPPLSHTVVRMRAA
jgi:alpha-N-arabinofuranosidase